MGTSNINYKTPVAKGMVLHGICSITERKPHYKIVYKIELDKKCNIEYVTLISITQDTGAAAEAFLAVNSTDFTIPEDESDSAPNGRLDHRFIIRHSWSELVEFSQSLKKKDQTYIKSFNAGNKLLENIDLAMKTMVETEAAVSAAKAKASAKNKGGGEALWGLGGIALTLLFLGIFRRPPKL